MYVPHHTLLPEHHGLTEPLFYSTVVLRVCERGLRTSDLTFICQMKNLKSRERKRFAQSEPAN